jgi:hypothetical protein
MRVGVWHNRAVGVYPQSPLLHADASRFRPLALVCVNVTRMALERCWLGPWSTLVSLNRRFAIPDE